MCYEGMAFRLLFDLGLHQDCTELMNAGCITENDRKARHVTLWGCYIIDKCVEPNNSLPAI
jgi:hypothetical protein